MLAATHRKHKRKQVLDPGDPPYQHVHTRMELDSHADTCALGDACVILQDTGKTVRVGGFGDSVGTVDGIAVVTAAVAYDCPKTFHTYVLIFHQSLYIPGMETHLINPFQLRNQGLTVNDVALQHMESDHRTTQSHALLCDDPVLHLPLTLEGSLVLL